MAPRHMQVDIDTDEESGEGSDDEHAGDDEACEHVILRLTA